MQETLRVLRFEKELQDQEDEGEKKRLARVKEALWAQLQEIKKASEVSVRSERDQNIITNFRKRVFGYVVILTKLRKS